MSKDIGQNFKPITKEDIVKSKIYKSEPIKLVVKKPDKINYVEIEFRKLDLKKDSCEARIFLNNPSADHNTRKTDENGYVGSLFVFGHGSSCYGGPGHCNVQERDSAFDMRPDHYLKPYDEFVNITEGFKKIFKKGEPVRITIVPILMSCDDMTDKVNVIKFEKPYIHVYCD